MFYSFVRPFIRPLIAPMVKPIGLPLLYQSIRQKTYLPTHEWLTDADKDGIIKMGISEKASKELGEVTFIDYLVDSTMIVENEEELVTIESVKAVAAIKAPFNCEIVEINEEFENNLDSINENAECEEKSWILKLKNLE